MKHILLFCLLCIPMQLTAELPAETLQALTAADDERIQAMQKGDATRLDHIFSDQLRYAHSNGVIDTKASFIEILSTGKTKYLSYEHAERQFELSTPGTALMHGITHIQAETETGVIQVKLSYLAAWRLENGHWRFLAWQSCRLP
jgi:hypothetical protein